jgi:hypothetical protein
MAPSQPTRRHLTYGLTAPESAPTKNPVQPPGAPPFCPFPPRIAVPTARWPLARPPD